MPKIARELFALDVKNLKKPGFHSLGGVAGLSMRIAPSGGKAFILRAKVGAHRSDIGLGGYPTVSLAQAKERARKLLEDIRQGIDPIADKKLRKNNVEWTFKRCVEDYLKSHRAGWKNAKHAQQWENTLVTYAFPTMGGKNVKDITVGDVLESIEPNWLTKNETMVRVRSRIELVLAWAATRGYRSKENPAAWKGNLDATLLRPSKAHTVKHHESLPYVQMKSFMVRLRQIESVGAKCLEWLILTGTRSNEARGTTWEEIDFAKKSWTIPPERMKGGREHRVPLSPAAILLLRKMPKFEGTTYVFPGSSNEKTLSDMTLTQILRRMKVAAVPHGFRTSLIEWASEATNFSEEEREMALAHKIDSKTQAAYQRGDMFDKRRIMMNAWADYIKSV